MIAHNLFVRDSEKDGKDEECYYACEKENVDSTPDNVVSNEAQFSGSRGNVVTRSMKRMLDGSPGSSSPLMAPGRKRKRSDMMTMAERTGVFKLNPLYQASDDSPNQKISISTCSPKTKEKEMVSAILELARYGEQQFPMKKKRCAKIAKQLASKFTVKQRRRSKAVQLHKRAHKKTYMEKMNHIP